MSPATISNNPKSSHTDQSDKTCSASNGLILSGWIAPHPPHLVYAENPPQNAPRSEGGWDVLRWAYEECQRRMAELKPDTIVVHTPHWQTSVGHHVIAVKELSGLSVDPIFPHLFRYRYHMQSDVALAESIYHEAKSAGLKSKLMQNPRLRVDYGTIVTLHMMNPKWDIPVVVVSANNSPYFFDEKSAQDEMATLGVATARAIAKSGRKVVLAASTSLSHRHFSEEPDPLCPEDMSREHVFSHQQYQWDMKILNLMRHGKMDELLVALPQFMSEAFAEVKAGSLMWMLSAMGFPKIPAKIYGYGNVIGTGNAVVEWALNET